MADTHDTLQDLAFVQRLSDVLAAGGTPVLSLVLDTRGSMPRDASAAMALLPDGTFLGTVGGGRVEQMCEEACVKVAEGGPCHLEWYTHAKTAMACGGDALVATFALTAAHAPFLASLAEAIPSLEPHWIELAFPAGSLVDAPGAGEGALVVADAPVSMTLHGDAGSQEGPTATGDEATSWDEERLIYREAMGVRPRVYIFGAGHVGRALVPALSRVGFDCIVHDDRAAVALPEHFPDAEAIVVGDFGELAEEAPITPRDYVVVLTHGHVADFEVLARVLPRHPRYVGCIGSRSKRGTCMRFLEDHGIPRADAEAVHLPIGDDILAVTPAEIAVSIAAQMIRARHS